MNMCRETVVTAGAAGMSVQAKNTPKGREEDYEEETVCDYALRCADFGVRICGKCCKH